MRILSNYQRWLARKGPAVEFVIGVAFIVAVSILLATLFQAFGANGHDAFNASLAITVVICTVINTPAGDPGKLNRWARWLAGQRPAVQAAIRFTLAVVVGAALFGFYYLMGLSRGWALGLAIFVVVFLSVTRIVLVRQKITTGVD